MLSKETSLFDRDEEGKLIPQTRELIVDEEDTEQIKYKGETIKLIPFARGELRKLFVSLGTDKDDENEDLDNRVITEKCIEPKFTKDEILHMRPGLTAAIVNTVLFESGIDTRNKSKSKALKEAEDEFSKNSEELNQKEKKGI